ncbi:plastocyanin/azurin family copper-binding protein [Pelagicoccus mobilis]|uniref:Blue (type 1) copper domain-containing protein n=1 Tax=Pelagicoccus mobilis TaxID=415221 RepID=A0A934RUZ0_9BACT|nr:plastocyanin/azurin family copper-binding protein [Pelagicoccus mobilis]MBK1875910.1 hypothetical protein [Pelagicoccus mobilis]
MRRLILFLFALASVAFSWAETLRFELKPAPGLKFDYSAFYVTPGQEVELTFRNTDIMLHNLVITAPGKREAVVKAAENLAYRAAKLNYIPRTEDVLWSIPVVNQGEAMAITFKAPEIEGKYPYVCTYPGHGYIMYGDMIVSQTPQAPVPFDAEAASEEEHSHALELTRPLVRRFFLPHTGPASIAVALPGGMSYCWDTGACRFRYAWAGGFVHNLDSLPSQAPSSAATLAGNIFYTETFEIPIRFGKGSYQATQEVQWRYLGYRLDSGGYPSFEYEVNGNRVIETVKIEHKMITRTFECDTDETVWFFFDPELGERFHADGERVEDAAAFRFPSDGSGKTSVTVTMHFH